MERVSYEVRIETVAARQLAAVREKIEEHDIPKRIGDLLGEVWTVLRANATPTDHNIAVYQHRWQDETGSTVHDVLFGVEVLGDFPANERVIRTMTPTGRVATTTHWGDYARLGDAYTAVRRWCSQNGLTLAEPFWEVYGDWSDDPNELRTDVFWLLQ